MMKRLIWAVAVLGCGGDATIEDAISAANETVKCDDFAWPSGGTYATVCSAACQHAPDETEPALPAGATCPSDTPTPGHRVEFMGYMGTCSVSLINVYWRHCFCTDEPMKVPPCKGAE